MNESAARSVYVISDLHLGGVYGKAPAGRGFRINTHVDRLSELVESLAQNAPTTAKTELVINGDMVDFLAEREEAPPFWNPFTRNPEAACAKLQAITDRDARFFQALGTFLDAGHRLTILTGNHDTELVLPPVRQKLKDVIGVKPGHDYEFICNGEAYVVGDALIEHGNRYDKWNVVDYDGLRRLSSGISRRQPVPKEYDFQPPAGSKMVSWVINEIKEDYKFIDLLKPETDVAIPLLLALEPGYRQILATVAKLGLQSRDHRMAAPALPSQKSDFDIQAGSTSGVGSKPPTPMDDDAALQQILKRCLGDASSGFQNALGLVGDASEEDYGADFSIGTSVDRAKGLISLLAAHDDQDIGSRLPALLCALQALQPDRSFDLDYETATEYSDAAKELFKGGFRYVIFGHTHMAKKIELQPGCWYLNCGTWADLMRLPAAILGSDVIEARKQLDLFVQDVGAGLLGRWVTFQPSYVRLDLDSSNRVLCAELKTLGGVAVSA